MHIAQWFEMKWWREPHQTHANPQSQNTIMDNITKQLFYLDAYQDVQRFYIYTPSQIILLYLYILVDENKIEDQSVHKMFVY